MTPVRSGVVLRSCFSEHRAEAEVRGWNLSDPMVAERVPSFVMTLLLQLMTQLGSRSLQPKVGGHGLDSE